MQIYTSFFGNNRKLRQNGIELVSIARYNPKFETGMVGWYPRLAPTSDLFHVSPEQYNFGMKAILLKADPQALIDYMNGLGLDRVALCCFEKDFNECHRKMVGEWLEKHIGKLDGVTFMGEYGLPQNAETQELLCL